MKITLQIQDKAITLATHEINGENLYRANDLALYYYNDTKKSQNKVNHWKSTIGPELLKNSVVAIQGKQGGSYVPDYLLLNLAGIIDNQFGIEVSKAFAALTRGDVEQAEQIADAVVTREKTHALMQKKKPLYGIRSAFTESGTEILAFVESMLETSQRTNHKVGFDDRARFVDSLLAFVNEYFDSLSARDMASINGCYAALALLEAHKRRVHTFKAKHGQTASQRHEKEIRSRARRIGDIALKQRDLLKAA
ncbi:hypothetical protein KW508_03560 [Vibrio fluvialis]|nr:hypothetical protein [Vibrio fluvialis]